jgi:sec-independent protein translocase protein TatA
MMSHAAGFFSMPGGSEWIIIFVVILIIFGPKSLPKIGHAIGRGIREFKDASDGITKAIEEEASAQDREEEARKKESTVASAHAESSPAPSETPDGASIHPAD